jgi:hypothetical protein
LCTHPVLPQEPEFHQGEVNWRRDGVNIISVDDFGHRKLLNSTTTKLEFPITENTTGNYTCFVQNSVQGEVNESNTVTVGPSGEFCVVKYTAKIIVIFLLDMLTHMYI